MAVSHGDAAHVRREVRGLGRGQPRSVSSRTVRLVESVDRFARRAAVPTLETDLAADRAARATDDPSSLPARTTCEPWSRPRGMDHVPARLHLPVWGAARRLLSKPGRERMVGSDESQCDAPVVPTTPRTCVTSDAARRGAPAIVQRPSRPAAVEEAVCRLRTDAGPDLRVAIACSSAHCALDDRRRRRVTRLSPGRSDRFPRRHRCSLSHRNQQPRRDLAAGRARRPRVRDCRVAGTRRLPPAHPVDRQRADPGAGRRTADPPALPRGRLSIVPRARCDKPVHWSRGGAAPPWGHGPEASPAGARRPDRTHCHGDLGHALRRSGDRQRAGRP